MASSATMKTTLVVMLLLAAVVASHGRAVSCKNSCPRPVTVCGTVVPPGATKVVNVLGFVKILVTDKYGKLVSASFYCPNDVNAVNVLYELGYLKLKVIGLVKGLLGGVLTLLYQVLGTVRCIL